MGLGSLVREGVEEVLRGFLEQEIARSGSRLRPGGYARAIQKVIERMRIRTSYDRRILRERIGPNVLERFRISRRQRNPDQPPIRNVPTAPGERPTRNAPLIYEYTIRGRIENQHGPGRVDFLLVVQSAEPLSWAELQARAREMAVAGDLHRDYVGRVEGLDTVERIDWALIDVVRRPRTREQTDE